MTDVVARAAAAARRVYPGVPDAEALALSHAPEFAAGLRFPASGEQLTVLRCWRRRLADALARAEADEVLDDEPETARCPRCI